MKRKQIIIGIIVALCIGLGLYALSKRRGTGYASDEDQESVPTIVSVQTGSLQPRTLHRYVTGYGTVAAAPADADHPAAGAQLAAPSAGVLARVNVVEGQSVKQGDVLMELNAGAVTADYAEQEVARQRKLYAQQNTSLKNLQDAEAQLAALQVIAPLSGTVTRLNVKPGEAVDANIVVAELVDLRRLAVSAEIPVAGAADLQAGDEVQIQGNMPAMAAISFVSPAVDTNSDTVLVRALLPAGSGLRVGQLVALRIVTAVHTNCLAAPQESVVTGETGHSVIALVQGDQAVQTPVETGFREDGWVEVKGNGLKAGDTVVTVGAYGLPEKTQIRVLNSTGDETPATNSASSRAQ